MTTHESQKKIVIHQPNFAPWFGFFHKVAQGDVFVILDNVQYSKRSFQNRNKILTPDGPRWLTIPVKSHSYSSINEVFISYDQDWISDHLKTLQMSYARAPYYAYYIPKLEEILQKRHTTLSSLNSELITFILQELRMELSIVPASKLEIDHRTRSTERLVNICNALNGTVYVSGQGAKKYQDEDLFAEHNIALEYATPPTVTYPQVFSNTFVSHLSILDALFNCGGQKVATLLSSTQSIESSNVHTTYT